VRDEEDPPDAGLGLVPDAARRRVDELLRRELAREHARCPGAAPQQSGGRPLLRAKDCLVPALRGDLEQALRLVGRQRENVLVGRALPVGAVLEELPLRFLVACRSGSDRRARDVAAIRLEAMSEQEAAEVVRGRRIEHGEERRAVARCRRLGGEGQEVAEEDLVTARVAFDRVQRVA
jgi:hypothetical protein